MEAAIAPLPDFLSRYADLGLHAERDSLVALDGAFRIAWVSDGWTRFAFQNGAHDIVSRFGPGSHYLDGVAGDQRRHYEDVFGRALREGMPYESFYECSSADLFRLFRLRALPFEGRGLLLEHTLVETRQHDRDAEPPDPAAFTGDRGLITQCGNCRRTRHPVEQSWHWIPSWVQDAPTNTTHGVCAVCLGFYYGEFLQKKKR